MQRRLGSHSMKRMEGVLFCDGRGCEESIGPRLIEVVRTVNGAEGKIC